LLAYGKEHPDAEPEDVWATWRARRKGLSQRTGIAARLGFSSYSRFFRACVLCYGIEPSELEREIFEEVVTEPCAVVKQSEEVSEKSEIEGQKAEVKDDRPSWAGGWPGDRAG